MNINYLFPHKLKKMGWLVLLPSLIFGVIILITSYEPDILKLQVPAIFIDEFMGEKRFFGFIENNVLDEILGVLIICSSILVAFSKEIQEDEFIAKIRLDSLVWATYLNYGILLFAFLFIFDMSFLWVMVFNMFTILLFFIIRFHWKIYNLKRITGDEE